MGSEIFESWDLERLQISVRITKSHLLDKKLLFCNLSPNVLLDRPLIFQVLKEILEGIIIILYWKVPNLHPEII